MKLGPTPQNSWDVTPAEVSLIRPVLLPRPASIPAKPQNIVLDVARTGLVVVDMQNDFCAKGGWFAEKGADVSAPHRIVPAVQKLLPRSASRPRRCSGSIGETVPTTPNCRLRSCTQASRTAPVPATATCCRRVPVRFSCAARMARLSSLTCKTEPSDIFIHKTRFDGFIDNEFDSILRNRNISTLAVRRHQHRPLRASRR